VLAENVADAVGTIAPLFDDPDPDVRAAAARGMCGIADGPPQAVDSLIETFLNSDSFVEYMEHLFDALEGLGTRLPASTLEACRRADEATRAGCLDIIDNLTDVNAYGVDESLAEER
jgi:HEAT repeat protein